MLSLAPTRSFSLSLSLSLSNIHSLYQVALVKQKLSKLLCTHKFDDDDMTRGDSEVFEPRNSNPLKTTRSLNPFNPNPGTV